MEKGSQKQSFLRQYIKGEALMGGWGVAAQILGVLNAFIILSQLSVFKYGVYVLLFAFFSLVSSFFLSILFDVVSNDIARNIAENKEEDAKKLYLEFTVVRLIIAGIIFLAVFFGADIVASFYDEDIGLFLRILSFMFLITVFSTSMRIVFRARLQFGPPAARPVVYGFLKLTSLLILIFFFSITIENILIVHVGASFLSNIILLPAFLRVYRPWKKVTTSIDSKLWPIIKTYGKWPVFSHFLSTSTANVKPWLIKLFINTEAVAIYSVADSMFGLVKSLVPSGTLSAIIPRAMGDKRQALRIVLRSTKYILILSIFLGAGAAIFAPPVVKSLLPQYTASIPLFLLLLTALFFHSFRSIGTTYLLVLRRQKYLFFINTAKVVVSFLFPLIFLPLFGLWGMALDRILTMILIAVLAYGYIFWFIIPRNMWKLLITFNRNDIEFIKGVIAFVLTRAKKKFGLEAKN